MSRLPSEATQLRAIRSQLRKVENELAETNRLMKHYRARSTTAETEAADWRKRFDALLLRVPEVKP